MESGGADAAAERICLTIQELDSFFRRLEAEESMLSISVASSDNTLANAADICEEISLVLVESFESMVLLLWFSAPPLIL